MTDIYPLRWSVVERPGQPGMVSTNSTGEQGIRLEDLKEWQATAIAAILNGGTGLAR